MPASVARAGVVLMPVPPRNALHFAAIQGNAWSLGTSREALVDVAACRSTAERLMRERVGRDDAVCGVCAECTSFRVVCPFSRMTTDDDQR